MKRLVFAVSIVFGFGFMCGGAVDEDDDEEVVVVPVPEDGDDDGNWCCEYEDDDGKKRFALTDGAAACNNEFGDRDGRWVSDSKCTPCCCKAPNDPDDRSKGNNFELTTAVACSAVGECLAADAKQCGGTRGGDDRAQPRPRPRPSPGNKVDERKTRTPAPAQPVDRNRQGKGQKGKGS